MWGGGVKGTGVGGDGRGHFWKMSYMILLHLLGCLASLIYRRSSKTIFETQPHLICWSLDIETFTWPTTKKFLKLGDCFRSNTGIKWPATKKLLKLGYCFRSYSGEKWPTTKKFLKLGDCLRSYSGVKWGVANGRMLSRDGASTWKVCRGKNLCTK